MEVLTSQETRIVYIEIERCWDQVCVVRVDLEAHILQFNGWNLLTSKARIESSENHGKHKEAKNGRTRLNGIVACLLLSLSHS